MSGRSTRRRSKTARAMEAEEQAEAEKEKERTTPRQSAAKKRKSSSSARKAAATIVKPRYLGESNGLSDQQRTRRSLTPSSRSSSRAPSPASSSATASTRSSSRRRSSTQRSTNYAGNNSSSSKRTSGANTPVSRASRSSSVASNSNRGGGGAGGGIPKLKLKTKLGRGYNPGLVNERESEYHYGSDFEDDEYQAEEAESDKSSDDSDDDLAVEDSDDLNPESDVDLDEIVPANSLPQTPVPFWLREDEEIPPIALPDSSEDLLVPNDHLLKVFSVYEVLRRYHQILRLTPFRIEDFCSAIASEEQSNLLSEVHMALVRTLVRSEESNFGFGASDQKDSISCVFFFMDSVTWPDALRMFLQSDPAYEEPLQIMNKYEYPFGGPDVMIKNRVEILSFLADQILSTSVVRDFIAEDGRMAPEEHCRVCHRLGEMLVCDSCPGNGSGRMQRKGKPG